MHEIASMRDRTQVFRDRTHAGQLLAELLRTQRERAAVVVAIPAGGVPVGAVVARSLGLPLDIAVVSKITLPTNSEMGYGAVAFDGTTRLNDALLPYLGLGEEEVEAGTRRTREKVERRVRELCGGNAAPNVQGKAIVLVDDGLASGFTMRVAVAAIAAAGATRVVVAVPTAHATTARALEEDVDDLFVPNLRAGASFAVADAYQLWTDVSDEEVRAAMAG
jgi:predicted phosphoribosyltransferase